MYIKVCSRLVLGLTQMMTNDKSANELPRESQNVLTNGSKELIVGPLLNSAREVVKNNEKKKELPFPGGAKDFHTFHINFFKTKNSCLTWKVNISHPELQGLGQNLNIFDLFYFLTDSLTKGVTTALWLPTCVSVILVMMASMIFSPLVGYGFFLCSLSQAFKVAVDSLVAFFLLAAKSP